MTSEDIIALSEAIMKRHGKDDALPPACAAVIGEILRRAPEEGRNLVFASLVELIWASINPGHAEVVHHAVPVNRTAAEHGAGAAATLLLLGTLSDLYQGLLLGASNEGEDDATPVLNAWLSAHLEVTVAVYGAEKAADFLREAADGLVGATETRDALRSMDERATHEAGRA